MIFSKVCFLRFLLYFYYHYIYSVYREANKNLVRRNISRLKVGFHNNNLDSGKTKPPVYGRERLHHVQRSRPFALYETSC